MVCSAGEKFVTLRRGKRIWAIGSINGAAAQLKQLHADLDALWEPGDRFVYLGNYWGPGTAPIETFDELLRFRRTILAKRNVSACDIVFLRGSQEEMWSKLMQLHLAINPAEVLGWMLPRGIAGALHAYGQSDSSAITNARSGARFLARWLNDLRTTIQQKHPGHIELMTSLRRFARTDDSRLLLVHAGLDPARPLDAQTDAFWWGHPGFEELKEPYAGFRRVIRGFAKNHPGIKLDPHCTTVDGGAGEHGLLMAACFDPAGTLLGQIEA
jgi:serine/threonine protein phosphatase 1